MMVEKDGRRYALHPLKEEKLEEQVIPRVVLVGGKEFMHQLRDTEVSFSIIGKPNIVLTSTIFDNLLVEIQDLLSKHVDIVVDDFQNEFPPVRSISHHIDLILGASFPNKAAYRMKPRENEEIKN